jgi:ABC-type phosphate/phosphonate transport system substrate-binding protein
MAALRLLAYLGAGADVIAGAIAESLTVRLGMEVTTDPTEPWPARRAAIDRGEADLLWMCGLATAEAVDAGRLASDIVAAPVFAGHAGPTYHAVIVARRGGRPATIADLAGTRLAINERTSWSGYHALRAHLAAHGQTRSPFAAIVETGGHAASLEAVLAGVTDVAAIDDTVFGPFAARDARARDLAVIDRTVDWPAPPFSVARRLPPEVRSAVTATLPTVRPPGLEAIVPADDGHYDPIRAAMAAAATVDW